MNILVNYPGSNIIVNSAKDNIVHLEQDLRDTADWWFYWNFCVENAQGKELEFHFDNGEVISNVGPACSDDGDIWNWCKPENIINNSTFKFSFNMDETKKYFAFSLPYQVHHFEKFYQKIMHDSMITRTTLAISEQGRAIPVIKIGSNWNRSILITCRHHSCEAVASYVLEGLIHAVLHECRHMLVGYTFHIVPFIDIDGVENGDQGKDRLPHDHNRDYIESPLYNVTKALYQYTENISITAFLDFHCPWKWGGMNDIPHFYEYEDSTVQQLFLQKLTEITRSSDGIEYDINSYRMPYGFSYNQINLPCSKNFFAKNRNAVLSLSVETPYFGALEKPYSIVDLHEWGKNILSALDFSLKT